MVGRMTSERAQRSLGRLLLKGLKANPGVIYELQQRLGVSPGDVANDVKEKKINLHQDWKIKAMIHSVFQSLPRLKSRAFNLFHLIRKTVSTLRNLPQKRRKHIRDTAGYVRRRPSYAV